MEGTVQKERLPTLRHFLYLCRMETLGSCGSSVQDYPPKKFQRPSRPRLSELSSPQVTSDFHSTQGLQKGTTEIPEELNLRTGVIRPTSP